MMTRDADDLLHRVAEFIDREQGSPGFLDRFTEVVPGDNPLASRVLDEALAARARAGTARLTLGPGDLRVCKTSSQASLTACALATPDGGLAASVRLADADRQLLGGAVIRFISADQEHVVVTDRAGAATITAAGPDLLLHLGSGNATGMGGDQGARPGLIALPSALRREAFDLAAADRSDLASQPGTKPSRLEADAAADPGQWLIEAGGVAFWCMERQGGYDITAVVAGVPSAFAAEAAGSHGVGFITWGRNQGPNHWIVLLAPSPLGLAGSLYGIHEDCLDAGSVAVGASEELIGRVGDQVGEVVGRSVGHADATTGWEALSRRMAPGLPRSAVEAALARREAES